MDCLNTECNQADCSSTSGFESLVHVCTDIRFPRGTCSEVHIGPCGVFAITDGTQEPDLLYHSIRTSLGVPRVRLYLKGLGFYQPENGLVTDFQTDVDAFIATMDEFLSRSRIILSPSSILRCAERCREIDAQQRGEFVGEDGTLFLKRGSRFIPASPKDPENVFWLTVLGSGFGLHRFYMGKTFSAIFYLLTAGLCGIGSVIDLFLLLTGTLKDKHHRLIRSPKHRLRKIFAIPVCIMLSLTCLFLYTQILNLLSAEIMQGLSNAANHPGFTDFLLKLLGSTAQQVQ